MRENFTGVMEAGQEETRAWITFVTAYKWKGKVETVYYSPFFFSFL